MSKTVMMVWYDVMCT